MRSLFLQIKNHRLVRFILVGLANATLHFTVLNAAFYIFNSSKIVASIIATLCAVTFSFFMNREFVFRAKEDSLVKEVVLFAVVTLSGMLLVHNLTYALFVHLLTGNEGRIADVLFTLTGQRFSDDFIDINVATIIGALAAMIWNYNGYRLFVFRNVKNLQQITEGDDDN